MPRECLKTGTQDTVGAANLSQKTTFMIQTRKPSRVVVQKGREGKGNKDQVEWNLMEIKQETEKQRFWQTKYFLLRGLVSPP